MLGVRLSGNKIGEHDEGATIGLDDDVAPIGGARECDENGRSSRDGEAARERDGVCVIVARGGH